MAIFKSKLLRSIEKEHLTTCVLLTSIQTHTARHDLIYIQKKTAGHFYLDRSPYSFK